MFLVEFTDGSTEFLTICKDGNFVVKQEFVSYGVAFPTPDEAAEFVVQSENRGTPARCGVRVDAGVSR